VYTATVRIPNSEAARIIRMAISPRLAMRRLEIFFTYDFGIILYLVHHNKNDKYIGKMIT
jgi:hypothetical protein